MDLPSINKRIHTLITFYAERKIADFAWEIKIPEKSLTRLFTPDKKTGKYPIPSIKILIAIIMAYPNISANWLLCGMGEVFVGTIITNVYKSCEKMYLRIINKQEDRIKQQAIEIGHLTEKIRRMQKNGKMNG